MKKRSIAGRLRNVALSGMQVFLLLLSCSLSAACAGHPLRPPAEISGRPLDAGVDSGTIFNMVAFAAKDRICAAREQQLRRPAKAPAGTSKWTPIPAVEHDPYPTYFRCMDTESVIACDAAEQDLRTVHTLLDRDPRLSSILPFDDLMVRLKQQCPAHRQLADEALRPSSRQALQRCEDRYQPVLITTAILLRTAPPRDEAALFLWSAECRGTAGYFFMNDRCTSLQRRPRSPDPDMAPRRELGVEAYFCPQIGNHFGS
jgi:hypothetical protein